MHVVGRLTVALVLVLAVTSPLVAQTADLLVDKTGPATATPASQVAYTVTLTNQGLADAASVVLTDVVPPGMTFFSASQNSGPAFVCGQASSPSRAECTIATLGASASAVFTFTFTTAPESGPGTTFTNTATATTATSESATNNNSDTVQTTIPIPPQADLSVTKSGPETAAAGTDVTYTVTVTNSGPDDASTVVLTDNIPAGMTFVSVTQENGPTFACPTQGPTQIQCNLADMPANVTATFTVVLAIPSDASPGTSFSNIASASTSTNDPNEEDNSAVVVTTTPFPPQGDLGVTKTGPVSAPPDSDVTFTVTLTNGGPDAAVNVLLTDNLPAPLTFVSFLQISGPTMSCGTSTCSLASFPVGTTAVFELTGHIPAGTPSGTTIENVATAESDNDPNEENNLSTALVTVSTVDVVVDKAGPTALSAGTNVVYTVTVTNAGPDPAVNITLIDALPPGTTLVAFSQTNGPGASCDLPAIGGNGTIFCSLALLPATQSAEFSITVNADETTSITNTASASTDSFDTDLSDNSDSVSTTVTPQADLGVTKSGPPTVTAGSNVTYTVSLSNNGPSSAANVVLTDTLPANTTFVSATTASAFNCGFGGGAITCSLASFPADSTATFTFVLAVSPAATGSIDNTAAVTSTTNDPAPGNESSSVSSTVVVSTDVSVTKSGPAAVSAGSNATFTLTVVNAGPSAASNVVLTETTPAGTTFVSLTQNTGPAFNCVGQTCTIASLGPAASATFTYVVTVNAGATGTVDNTATVSTTSPDAEPANDSDTAVAAIDPGPTDLSIVKTASGTTFKAGEVVTYTLLVTNNGPNVAFATTVTDILPTGTTLVAATPSQGSCSGTTTVTCNLGTLAVSASATIQLDVRLSAAIGAVSNTATVSAVNAETNGTNNASTTALAVVGEIPSLSEWGLLLLAAFLAMAAVMTLRS